MSEIYCLQVTPEGYRMAKLDEDFNLLSIYNMTLRRGRVSCECFAANKETCRHRQMVTLFKQTNRVDKGWLYNHSTSQWVKPVRY